MSTQTYFIHEDFTITKKLYVIGTDSDVLWFDLTFISYQKCVHVENERF